MVGWAIVVIVACFGIDWFLEQRDHPAIHRRTKIAYIVNWCVWTAVGVIAAAVLVNPAVAAGLLFGSVVMWMKSRHDHIWSYERRFDELY
ncbi:hypothetical protein [Prescottella agglutinans]|uniref:Flp pilus assembly protein TadB n=1 Tax=Prescottella agglutinans TaxID=1644129 RepID=A0ABT6MK08_9NOCA|nr:hypothetical protein [Prescottella agglutinans]MDH6284625.1 Flp pilus assembly protein TadB [Prescottella agglutinans]